MKKIFEHSKLIVIVIALITAVFAFHIPDIQINNNIKVFLPDDHVSKVTNRRIEDIFGNNDRMAVALNMKEGNIFDLENLSIIREITGELEGIHGIDEVTSLTNADFIEGSAEGMEVAELVEELPENDREIPEIKNKLLSWDFYRKNLFSDDFKSTQMLISLEDDLTTDDKQLIYREINQVIEDHQQHNFNSYIAGSTAVNVLMGEKMLEDIKRLIPFILVVIILALYLFFHRVYAVFLTLLTVIISSIWAMGLMAWLGINLTLVSTVIPVLLIAVGSAYGIHILSHYYDDLRAEEGELTQSRHRELVLEIVHRIGKPVFLAGITTVVGFGSLATSRIIPIRSFGIFTALGIVTAFMVAIFLIPALLLLRFENDNSEKPHKDMGKDRLNRVIKALHNLYAEKRISIILIVIVVVVSSVVGMSRIVIDTPLIEMFKEESEIRRADRFINEKFSGTSVLNVLIEGEDRGSLTDPEILKPMDDLQEYLMENYQTVGKASSVTDFIKRMNQVMNYPEEETETETDTEDVDRDRETTSDFGEEETSDFGEESTSDFQEEETSDVGVEEEAANSEVTEETTTDFGTDEETTSDFGDEDTTDAEEETTSDTDEEETTSSFYEEDTAEKEEQTEGQASPADEYQRLAGPSSQKTITEEEFVLILNRALARAERLNLSGEDMVELINKQFNYRGAAYYEIPYQTRRYPVDDKQGLKNLVSQYLLLYSGNLDDLINDQLEPSKAQMLVQLNDPSNLVTAEIKQEIRDYVDDKFPEGYQVTASGHANMALAANNLIISSQTRSILVSFVIVFMIVAFTYKSLVAGIYGIIPLGFSLLINFGLMGYTGIKLDVGTAMVASIAIGIGVDYTIHFLSTYHYERQKTDNLNLVTRRTLVSSGKAILFNAISVAAGFLVLLFSNFYPLVYLGLLIAITMFTSSIASLTILPILLNVFKPKFISK